MRHHKTELYHPCVSHPAGADGAARRPSPHDHRRAPRTMLPELERIKDKAKRAQAAQSLPKVFGLPKVNHLGIPRSKLHQRRYKFSTTLTMVYDVKELGAGAAEEFWQLLRHVRRSVDCSLKSLKQARVCPQWSIRPLLLPNPNPDLTPHPRPRPQPAQLYSLFRAACEPGMTEVGTSTFKLIMRSFGLRDQILVDRRALFPLLDHFFPSSHSPLPHSVVNFVTSVRAGSSTPSTTARATSSTTATCSAGPHMAWCTPTPCTFLSVHC